MAKIHIQGGLEHDDFYAEIDGKEYLVGIAEYDLNDSGVRLRVMEFADSLEDRCQELEANVNDILGAANVKELTALEADQKRLEAIYEADDSIINLTALEAVEKKIGDIYFKSGMEKSRLDSAFADKLIEDADNVFGVGFCANAIGSNCRNYLTLMEVLIGIVEKYGAKPNVQMDKLINSTKNREQKRLEKHGKGKRKH